MTLNYRYFILVLAVILIGFGCKKKDTAENPPPIVPPVVEDSTYYWGMDLSYQPEIEDWNTTYYDEDGQPIEMLSFIASQGVNLVRLKLWHSPENEYNGLESVVAYAKRIKALGMDILLDFHYSDTWADPGKQFIPAAWEGLTTDQLNDSIYSYTKKVLEQFKQEDALPVIVQIGNETNSGFLWDQGRVGGSFDDNWANYTTLVKSAIKAVDEVSDGEAAVKTMIHFAGLDGASWYFDNMVQYLVNFDVIGLSFYSIWHGTSYDAFETKLTELTNRYDKEIMIVETGYPWTLEWNDWTNNLYGQDNQLFPDIPATPEGQKAFLTRLNNTLHELGEKGIGFCYWAPDAVAWKGPQATDGSAWENVAVFDFDNTVLPVMKVFNEGIAEGK